VTPVFISNEKVGGAGTLRIAAALTYNSNESVP
jgi:hypothetical protein